MSFANLKAQSGNTIAALQAKVTENANGGGGGGKDARMWKFNYDKATKSGSALIRFMPTCNKAKPEGMAWAEWFEFSFKQKGNNYWNRSLTTLGESDPVALLNKAQWAAIGNNKKSPEADQARLRNRRSKYVANIVVVQDLAHPENNGKNFLFEYGPAIHKKVIAAISPEYAHLQPCDVHDLWQGANFRLLAKQGDGEWVTYDDSNFEAPCALHPDDTMLESLYNGMYDLGEFEAASNYKSFDELNEQMRKVLGNQYVARIMGEEFTPEAAAAGGMGASPFGAAATTTAPAASPFAAAQATPVTTAPVSPFAAQQAAAVTPEAAAPAAASPFGAAVKPDMDLEDASAATPATNPFANATPAVAAGQPAASPFAAAQATPADAAADPFAQLSLS